MNFQHLGHFELRQICSFMAVVQAGNNFSQAANHLGTQQPPLSRSIQALEKLLSDPKKTYAVKLFDRSRRPIELTEAGRVFLAEATLALTHLDQAIAQARQASQGQIGRLMVGMNNSISNSILPEILREFQERFPKVELELREVTIQQEIPMLKNHQLDVVFQRSPYVDENDPSLSFSPILQEYFVVALPEKHILASQNQVSLDALRDEAIILPSLDVLPFYKKVIALSRESGFEPRLVQTTAVTGVVALLSLVAAGIGVAILPNHVQTLHREGVIYRSLQGINLTREIAVVRRQEDSSIVLREFFNVIQDVMNLSLQDSW